MAIAFVNATEAGSGAATQSQAINVPTHTDGDLLLLFAATADGDTDSVQTPSGWTEIVDNLNTGGAAPSPPGISVFWRIASSEPASYNIQSTDPVNTGLGGQMLCFSGVDGTTPIDVTSTTATGDSTNANPASIDPVTAGNAVVVGAVWDSTTAVFSAVPSGYTSPSSLGAVTCNGGGNGCTLATAYDLTPSDPEDPPAFTSSAEQWACPTVALRPAPVGGAFDQTNFRGRNDDDSEVDATWKATAGTDFSQVQDENFRIRFLIQEDDDVEDLNVEFQLQYNLNAAGWNDVNGSSSVVRSFASAEFTDGATTTQQIGAGTFIGTNNGMDEVNGLAGGAGMDFTTTVNQESEVEYCIQIRSADTSRGDTIQLRVIKEPDLVFATYTDTPTITIPEGAGMMLASAQLLVGAAGAQNPGTFNFEKSLPWGAITMALRPVGGGTTSTLAPTAKFDTLQTTGSITIQDGAMVDGLTLNSDVVLGDVVNLTDVTINGDLSILTGGTYAFSNVTVTGNITNDDNSANVLINATNGSSLTTTEPGTGITQVDIQNQVVVTVTVLDSAGDPIETAQVWIADAATEATIILNADTNASGIATVGFNYSTDLDIIVRVRKSSTGSTRYIPDVSTGTITATGFASTRTLILDSIVDP